MKDICMLCFRRREIIAPLPDTDSGRITLMTGGLYHIIAFILRRTIAKPYCAECLTSWKGNYPYSEFFEHRFSKDEWEEAHRRQRTKDVCELIGVEYDPSTGPVLNDRNMWAFDRLTNETQLPRHSVPEDVLKNKEYPLFEKEETVLFAADLGVGTGVSLKEWASRAWRKYLSKPILPPEHFGRRSYKRAILTDRHLILVVFEGTGYKYLYSKYFVYRFTFSEIGALVSDGEFLNIYLTSFHHPRVRIRTGRNTGRLLAQLYGLMDVGLIKEPVKIFDRPNNWEFNDKWRDLPSTF